MTKRATINQLYVLLDAAESKFKNGLGLIHSVKEGLDTIGPEIGFSTNKPELVLSVIENGKEKLVHYRGVKQYSPHKYDLWVNLTEMKLTLKTGRQILTIDLVKTKLSKKALKVLRTLMMYPHKIFSSGSIALYNFLPVDEITDEILWKVIHDIRKIVQDGKTDGPWIKTARQVDQATVGEGSGYFFEPVGSYCLISYISVDSGNYKERNQGIERAI